MLIRRRRDWELSERDATPESAVLHRRTLGGGIAAAAVLAAIPARAWSLFGADAPPAPPIERKPLAAARNPAYAPGRAITAEAEASDYNNFYEFGMSKSVAREAAALKVEPWTVELAGMVKTPRTIGIGDLLKQMALEERVYRHRCVEAWAMTVPWVGFPLAALVKLADPVGSPKYLKFTTLADEKTMPGLGQTFYPWPYTEGITLQEATNELAFVSVGMYGKTLPPQNGAPLRITLPWKYGFKSAKSIVRIEFTNERPHSFWEALQASEYGFWANVNPEVPHPRWSQARERLLGSGEMVATTIWNGYGPQVASMYTDKTSERLFA